MRWGVMEFGVTVCGLFHLHSVTPHSVTLGLLLLRGRSSGLHASSRRSALRASGRCSTLGARGRSSALRARGSRRSSATRSRSGCTLGRLFLHGLGKLLLPVPHLGQPENALA